VLSWGPNRRRRDRLVLGPRLPGRKGAFATYQSRAAGDYSGAGVRRRTAKESMKREMPLKIKLTPISVPITQTELDGQWAQIKNPRISVMMPSNNTQPELWTLRC